MSGQPAAGAATPSRSEAGSRSAEARPPLLAEAEHQKDIDALLESPFGGGGKDIFGRQCHAEDVKGNADGLMVKCGDAPSAKDDVPSAEATPARPHRSARGGKHTSSDAFPALASPARPQRSAEGAMGTSSDSDSEDASRAPASPRRIPADLSELSAWYGEDGKALIFHGPTKSKARYLQHQMASEDH